MRDYMGAGSVFHLFPGPFTARSRKTTSATAANIRLISSVRASSFWTSFLNNQDLAYFETEQDKVSFFCEQLEISKDLLPPRFTKALQAAVLRFVILWINILSSLPRPPRGSRCGHAELCGFGVRNAFQLHRSRQRLSGVVPAAKTFRFLYIAPKDAHFRTAEDRFRALVKKAA